ncbi:MAG TPA: hypothetical protein VJU59_22625, partial [Paraburkholderia sp.]|uniref:hypothetical protein n=1 Tax=Paraburkholderia sp. TaxID=1926495 RepID=UPI002B473CBE
FCVAASAAEKRDYEESFSLRQPLFFAHRLKKLPTPASTGFRGGLRCPDVKDIELRRGRILSPPHARCKGVAKINSIAVPGDRISQPLTCS